MYSHQETESDHELLKAVYEAYTDGILIADAETRKISMGNAVIRNMLGYTENELLDLSVDQIHPEKALPFVLDQFHRQFRGERRVSRYTPVLRKDGSVFYADISASPITLQGKNHLIGFFRDVTELKELEAGLRDSINKLEILNNITREISSSLEPSRVFERAVELSAQLIGGDGGSLAIYDFSSQRMTYPYQYNMPNSISRKIAETGSGIAELVMREGAMIVEDYAAHPRSLEAFAAVGLKAMVAVPVSSKYRELGALGIFGFSEEKRFSSKDLELLEAAGRQVGVAVENAFLYEKARKDMAEIERVSTNLRKKEERFRNIIESINDWIWEIDVDGRYTYVSPRVKDLLGYEPEEILGKSPFDLMPPEEAERVKIAFLPFKQNRSRFSQLENWNQHKDGHLVLLETSGFPLIDSDGTLVGYRGVDRDITRRKQAQNALKKSEETFRSLVENNFDVILTMGIDHTVTYVSPAIKRLAGLDPEEMVGTDVLDYFPEADADRIHEVLNRILTGQVVEMMEIRLLKSDDTFLHIESNATPIVEESAVTGAQLIFRDITEKKKLEEQLRHKQKIEAIGTLTAGITHDFNNILGIIMGNTELAIMKVPENHPVRKSLDQVMNASGRARQIVRQLLQFSRASEEMRMQVLPVPLVRESLKFLQATIPAAIEIREFLPEKTHVIIADPTQIQQVVINLCTNAVHAMAQKGGILEINVENLHLERQEALRLDRDLNPGTYVRLTVSDSGYGMTREVMDRIFEPYFSTKPVDEGSGMGLAVVHGIVKKYDGAIEVESIPGEGSTFRVYFPAVTELEQEETISQEHELEPGMGRILYVDDEQMLVSMWKELLSSLGYNVEGFTDPAEALESFAANPDRFDLVITDMNMPKITGDRFSEQILKIRSDMPIILASGYGTPLDTEKFPFRKIAGFIEKPTPIEAMTEKIREVLGSDDNPGE